MSTKMGKQIRVELEQLDLLLRRRHPGLIERCRSEAPSNVEIDALAAMLHAFYTGVENIFKRASVAVDGQATRGDNSI